MLFNENPSCMSHRQDVHEDEFSNDCAKGGLPRIPDGQLHLLLEIQGLTPCTSQGYPVSLWLRILCGWSLDEF